jgi:hypothetical protein
VKKLDLEIMAETYGDRGLLRVGIRQSEATDTLLKMKALIWKVSTEEAATLDWPGGMTVEKVD